MPIRTVGIIGAGTMGSGIAQVFATAGFDVVVTDVTEAVARKGAAAVADNLERLVAKASSASWPRRRSPRETGRRRCGASSRRRATRISVRWTF